MNANSPASVPLLGNCFVRLDSHNSDDLSVINSARVSFGNRHEQMEPGDDKLIDFLLRKRHGSPFEHNMLRFHVKAPIFVIREWQRHRISSFNEMSMRYTVVPDPEFYIPDIDNVRQRVGKPGAYTYEPAPKEEAVWFRNCLTHLCRTSAEKYKQALDYGIAPEQARMMLHVNVLSEMYWTVNARSLMNFLSLRNHPEAQMEIRVFAEAIENIWAELMPITAESFVRHGRKSP